MQHVSLLISRYTVTMEITWFGTASIRIRIQELSLLFDPFAPLPGASFAVPHEHFLPAPFIFITHGHFDHVHSVPHLVQLGAGKVFATKSPHEVLAGQGVPPKSLHCVCPGDSLRFLAASGSLVGHIAQGLPDSASSTAPNTVSPDRTSDLVTVTVRRSRHIRFDVPYVLSTLFNARMLRYLNNTKTMIAAIRTFRENNETVVFEITHNNETVIVLGSLALAENEPYTQGPDLLVMPYQGRSHLEPIALSIVERLKPRLVLLDHFDDSFPPISRDIDTASFLSAMRELHPGIQVIVPRREITHHI